MITLFCCKNQNSDKTVGLNNSAARAKVMPRSMSDCHVSLKFFWHQLLAHPKFSLRLLLPVTKSFSDNAIALYSSCVCTCSSLAAVLPEKSGRLSHPNLKLRGSIPSIPRLRRLCTHTQFNVEVSDAGFASDHRLVTAKLGLRPPAQPAIPCSAELPTSTSRSASLQFDVRRSTLCQR